MDMQEQLRKIQEEAANQLENVRDKAGLDALRLKMLGKILQKKETLKIQMEMKHYKKQSRMVYNKKKRSNVSQ